MLTWVCGVLGAGAAQPVVGVALSPRELFAPTATTELQRAIRPPLAAYGGVRMGRVSLLGSLAVATVQLTSRSEEVVARQRAGLVRPGLDVRVALLDRPDGVPEPFLLAGGQVTVPLVADVSSDFTPEEQAVLDEAADVERRRLGRFGGRLGAGALVRLHPSIGLGVQFSVAYDRSFALGGQPGTVSHEVTSDAALLLDLTW